MITRLLKRWDIDPLQLKALLKVSLLQDLRSQRKLGGTRARRLSPMVWSLLFYFWMGILLSANLVGRAPLFLYSLLCLAYAQVMSVFVVLLEFGDTLVHPDDGDILGTRPLSSRTYFWGKVLNLLAYVTVVGLALNIGPAFVGMALSGGMWIFPLAYLPLALLACLASAALVVWIYTGLVRLIPGDRFKDLLAYLQALFSFAVFFGYQLLPRMSRHALQGGGEISGTWVWLAPPAWFAGTVRLCSGHPRPHDGTLTALALGSALLLFAIAFRKISLNYSDQVARLRAQSSRKTRSPRRASSIRSGFDFWIARRIRHSETRAGYQLTSAMMRKDRQVKMTIYPLLAMPLAFFALAWMEGELTNPLSAGGSAGGTFGYMTLFFIFFMIHTLIHSLLYAKEPEAAWVMSAAPVTSPGRFVRGMVWAVMVRGVLPFFLLCGLAFSRVSPWEDTLRLMGILASWGFAFTAVSLLWVRHWPFSRLRERGDRSAQLALMLTAAPFFGLVSALLWAVTQWPAAFWGVLALGIVLYMAIESRAMKRIDKTFFKGSLF